MLKKILIIEDEQILRELLSRKLQQEGYDVLEASDGVEGLNLIRQERPDLILTDIVMPKLGGYELLEIIKNDPLTRHIPVIVVSNSGQYFELEKARDLGALDVLIKTQFNPEELAEKVRAYIINSNNI